MAKKRKTLPKNIQELIEQKEITKLKEVLNTCEIDARGGYGKSTILSYYYVPNEIVEWLVGKGANIDAFDVYGCTALHRHSSFHSGDISIFIRLGADVNFQNKNGETPLHYASGGRFKVNDVKMLIKNGAKTDILNKNNQTPLTYALKRANNINLIELVEIVRIFLKINNEITQEMKDLVLKLGVNFEFHRANFNEDSLEETDKALNNLYEIFNVSPIKKRVMHDGISTIILKGETWQKQYEELWDFLIPSNGEAKTIQGEVVRISGKVRDEIYRNGGGNWNASFKKMLDTYLKYLNMKNSLDKQEIEKITILVKDIRKYGDAETNELNYLCELATKWVSLNPNPISLTK